MPLKLDSRVCPSLVNFQGLKDLTIILPVKVHGPDTDDFAILDIDTRWITSAQQTAESQGPDNGFVGLEFGCCRLSVVFFFSAYSNPPVYRS